MEQSGGAQKPVTRLALKGAQGVGRQECQSIRTSRCRTDDWRLIDCLFA